MSLIFGEAWWVRSITRRLYYGLRVDHAREGEWPVVSLQERDRICALASDRQTHARLCRELPFLDEFETRSAADPVSAPSGEGLRVIAWNAERGRRTPSAAAMLRRASADVYLLSELDLGMARTEQRHTTREMADALGCGYAYAVEFLELGLGDESERAQHAGESNSLGYHGGAILSRAAIEAPRIVRLGSQGRWFDGTLGERRVGDRMALCAWLPLKRGALVLASVHLESHSDPQERADQLEVLLDAIDGFAQGAPALIGGDMNTSSLGFEHADPARLGAALRDDPERFGNPVPHEPLFGLLERRGYEWRACNQLDRGTQRKKSPSARAVLHLDWIFCRGVRASAAEVVAAVDPESGEALSDHEAVAVTVSLV